MTEPLHSLTHVIETAISSLQYRPRNLPSIIEWACPVPFFGRAEKARVASVGLNPSDQEFRNRAGEPLQDDERRLATLDSLGLQDWSVAGPAECSRVAEACSGYFDGKPYRWFDPLEEIFKRAGRGTLHGGGACHIDLAPWATTKVWRRLSPAERCALLECGGQTLVSLLRSAQFRVLLLNGISVIEGLQHATGMNVSKFDPDDEWDSPARTRCWLIPDDSLGCVELERPVTMLGWNWHLQRTSAENRDRIIEWAAQAIGLPDPVSAAACPGMPMVPSPDRLDAAVGGGANPAD